MMTEKTKMISIKIKLLGIMLPMIILIMTVLTGLSYYVSKKAMQSNARKLLQTSVESQAAEMEAWLERNLVSVSVAKQAVEKMEFDDRQMQDFLDSYYNYDSNYSVLPNAGIHVPGLLSEYILFSGYVCPASAFAAFSITEPGIFYN